MAIWQYTFQVLHKESVDLVDNECVFFRGENGFDDEVFWNKYPVKKFVFNKINSMLKKSKSWSDRIDLYGDQESDCFEVLFDDKDNVVSASFRIDFRGRYESILNGVIEFCILNGFIILDEGLNIVPLNFEQVRDVIESSPQLKKYNMLFKNDNNS